MVLFICGTVLAVDREAAQFVNVRYAHAHVVVSFSRSVDGASLIVYQVILSAWTLLLIMAGVIAAVIVDLVMAGGVVAEEVHAHSRRIQSLEIWEALFYN